MIWQFLIAGVLAALATIVHAVFGERTNIKHLLTSSVPPNEQIELRAVWHSFSIVLMLAAVGLLLLAFTNIIESPRTIAHMIAITFGASGILFLLLALRAGTKGVLQIPGWMFLLAIAVLSWWGAG